MEYVPEGRVGRSACEQVVASFRRHSISDEEVPYVGYLPSDCLKESIDTMPVSVECMTCQRREVPPLPAAYRIDWLFDFSHISYTLSFHPSSFFQGCSFSHTPFEKQHRPASQTSLSPTYTAVIV